MADKDKSTKQDTKDNKPTIKYEPTRPEIIHEPVKHSRTSRVFCKMGG